MKILISSLYFYPDHSGIALYSSDFAFYLAEQGHKVTVVTGFPFYPQWKKRKADVGKMFREDNEQGVRILRGYIYVPARVTTLMRILQELSFVFFSVIGFIRSGRHDCIVIFSPPTLLGLIGIMVKAFTSAQLVINVQDLQTDAAENLGMVKYRVLVEVLSKIEAFTYRHSDWIATISNGMKRVLLQKGVSEEKLTIIPNWIDVQKSSFSQPVGCFVSQYPELQGKCIIGYAGNIGIKQDIGVLVQAADMMQDESDVHFLIVGEGADKPRIEQMIDELALSNVTMLPFLSQARYFELLADIDILFVSQRSQTGNVFFPSKLLGIMAMSKPLLVSADLDSELGIVVAAANCGLVSPAGDYHRLSDNIRRLANDEPLRVKLGQAGRVKVNEYDREAVLSSFMTQIQDRI